MKTSCFFPQKGFIFTFHCCIVSYRRSYSKYLHCGIIFHLKRKKKTAWLEAQIECRRAKINEKFSTRFFYLFKLTLFDIYWVSKRGKCVWISWILSLSHATISRILSPLILLMVEKNIFFLLQTLLEDKFRAYFSKILLFAFLVQQNPQNPSECSINLLKNAPFV